MVDYKIALEIAAAGNAEEFLGRLSSRLLGIHGQTKAIGENIKGWGAVIGGAALALGSIEVLRFVDHIAKAGGDLQRQANIFLAAGNSMQDTARAVASAFDAIQKVPGVDAVDAMKRYREISGATQDNAGSLAVLPDFLRAQVVYGASTGADAEEGMKRVAKMIELRQGAIDHLTHKIVPQKFDAELDVAIKALQVGQGLITANDLQMIVKQAGPMAKGLDAMKFWSIYLASVEDMGGARTGTAMTAVARQVLGGIMTPSVKEEWAKLGMLDPQHRGWHTTKSGEIVIDDAKQAIRGFDTFNNEGFQAFVDKFVRPALVAHGYVTDKDQNAELYRFGSTETARRLYSMYLTGSEQVEAEQKKIAGAKGLSAYDDIYKGGDYQQGVDSLTASIKSLEEALGGPAGKALGAVATQIAEQINRLALIAHNHPEIVQIGTYAVTAAAGLAVLAGSIVAFTGALKLSKWALGFGEAAAGATAGATGAKAAAAATAAASSAPGGIPGLGWFRLGAFAWNSLSMLDSGDIGTPEWAARINAFDKKWNDWIFNHFGLGAPADPFPIDSTAHVGGWFQHSPFWHSERARADSALGRAGYRGGDLSSEMGRESSRGRALGAMAAPAPNVDVKVGITVSGDLKGLINAAVSSITQSGEFTHGPSTHDDHSSYAAPDMANW